MNKPSCANCKHWHGGMVCDAYPNGIPWPIISGDVAHTRPLPDDNGIRWERKDEAPQDEANDDEAGV